MVAGVFYCKFNHSQASESLLHVSEYEIFLTKFKVYLLHHFPSSHPHTKYLDYFLLAFSALHGICVFVYDTSLAYFLAVLF